MSNYIIIDGFDDCILGVTYGFNHESVVVYDFKKVIEKLELDGMSSEDAYEYWEYNILGAYMGEKTPIFLETLTIKDIIEMSDE